MQPHVEFLIMKAVLVLSMVPLETVAYVFLFFSTTYFPKKMYTKGMIV